MGSSDFALGSACNQYSVFRAASFLKSVVGEYSVVQVGLVDTAVQEHCVLCLLLR